MIFHVAHPVDPDDFDLIGHLVADIEQRAGTIIIATDSHFFQLSPVAQSEMLTDWIEILQGMKERLDVKKGSLQ